MSKIRIMAVCGFGIGTSLILKMKIEGVLKKHDIDADVFTADTTSAPSETADIIFTSQEISEVIASKVKAPMVIINNFLSEDELVGKAIPAIKKLS